MPISDSSRRIRSGLFEIDLDKGRVFRDGREVPVQEQPFRVLEMLIEQPGELVSRESLRARLWPADTYVSFDEGLNTAVRKLRVVFQDSADNPRFIQTVPRKGYRFIAPVTELPAGNGSAMAPAASLNGNPPAAPLAEAVSTLHETNRHAPAAAAPPRPRRRVWVWTLSLAAPVLLLLWLAAWYSRPRIPEVKSTVKVTNDGKAKIPFLAPATDGPHLYFVEGHPINSGSGIAQVSVTGGETTWIPTSLRGILALPSISPDGSKLLVIANPIDELPGGAEFWIQPLPGGSPFRVGHIIGSSACFTPDGAHILYEDEGRVMRVVNLDGSDSHTLATLPGFMHAPRYSPDGKRVRFWLGGAIIASGRTIWEMESDGTHLRPLFPNWKETTDQCCGAWSPDGAWYYFQASLGNDQAIWVLPERRSIFRRAPVPFRLTSGPLRYGGPSPSLDGKKLFVVGEEARVELFRYDLGAKRFDSYLGGLSAGPVDFSPDGRSIAYVTYPDMTLWRSRLDSSEKVQLTLPPMRAYEPRWSPDGSRIAFLDVQSGRPWTIRVINSEGGDSSRPVEVLTGDDSDSDPTWTPDGKSVVFSRISVSGKNARAIFFLNLDNGKLTQVPDSGQVFSPRLSPDGRFISALKAGGNALMLFDMKTNQWATLAAGEPMSFNEWSHDGQYVYWRAIHEGSGHLMRIRISDRAMEDVLDLKDFPALVDDFANWFGLTPDGGVLLMRDRSVQEVYALDLRFR
jgi:Tol biopolymer transport system component/DNA-binding winged helix-turn-helix (wHTH) protein